MLNWDWEIFLPKTKEKVAIIAQVKFVRLHGYKRKIWDVEPKLIDVKFKDENFKSPISKAELMTLVEKDLFHIWEHNNIED